MEKLSYRAVISLVPQRQRRQLLALAALRILANLLDLLGLAGIALLATTFGAIASGTSRQSPIELPIIGEVFITEIEAVVIAMAITLTFVIKSFFSIWLNLRTALKVAEIEGDFAERLTRDYFENQAPLKRSFQDTVSKFQTTILVSTSGLASFLRARLTFVAELSLLIALVTVFTAVNPIATVVLLVYLGGVLAGLNRIISNRLKRNSRRIVEGSERALTKSRDLLGVRREVVAAGNLESWLASIAIGKRLAAKGTGVNYTISALPRYVIETSLIMGIFAFLGGVVVFSDLASQSLTIGVFMAGGLRLVASLVPIQAAYTGMVSARATGEVAIKSLAAIDERKSYGEKSLALASEYDMAATLEFSGVTYSYPDSEQATVNDVSFAIPKNSKTAIVGPSGAGKSTIFELATGFKLPQKGQVQISGVPPRSLIGGKPGYIGIVPQRSHLITGTLAENVSLRNHGETNLEWASSCLDRAGLGNYADLNGLSHEITPDSGFLSGGEIQRLGLARALYGKPRILFLDEATSALDAETESRVSSFLDELKSEMTVVLIAHRLSTVMNADSIIYVEHGKAVAQGTFAELKKAWPAFAQAVRLLDVGGIG